MATFPDYPQSYNSTVTPQSGITLDFSIGGDLKGRNLFDSSIYNIVVEYEWLDESQKDFMESFWQLYQNDKNTIYCAVDRHTYEVLFENEPKFTQPAPNNWNCMINLKGKRIT